MLVVSSIPLPSGIDDSKGIIIDCEHGNITDDSMHSSTAAIAAMGVSPLVRLRMTHTDLIKRALDAGAQWVVFAWPRYIADKPSSGIIIPQINTAEEAKNIVSHAKFPPQGLRGQGSAFAAIAHKVDTPMYVKTANETLITCLQIETKAGLENVDAISAVPGIGESEMPQDR